MTDQRSLLLLLAGAVVLVAAVFGALHFAGTFSSGSDAPEVAMSKGDVEKIVIERPLIRERITGMHGTAALERHAALVIADVTDEQAVSGRARRWRDRFPVDDRSAFHNDPTAGLTVGADGEQHWSRGVVVTPEELFGCAGRGESAGLAQPTHQCEPAGLARNR